MNQIKTNRAIVFGVFKPGEKDLVQALEEWDDSGENKTNMPAFIETEFRSFRIDSQELKNEVCSTVYIRYSREGKCRGYALTSTSKDDVRIHLDDYHPLTQFIRKYQDKVAIGGMYSDFTSGKDLDSFDWNKLRSTGRELFYSALRHYQAKRQKQFMEKRDAFLNFFRDPLCLAGAMVGTLLSVSNPISNATDNHKPIPLDDINLPLLPPIQVDYDQAKNDNMGITNGTPQLLEAREDAACGTLPEVVQSDGDANESALPAVMNSNDAATSMALRREIALHPERSKNKFLQVASKRVLGALGITPDKLDEAGFLLICLSDDRLLEYYEILAPILIDEESETIQRNVYNKKDISVWQNDFDSLLNNEFQMVGNLLAGIDGLHKLSQAFEDIERDERPEIIIPNCSLSKIYERDDIRGKFETLLHNTNSHETNLQDYIGFCVVPRVAYDEKEVRDEDESLFDDPLPTSQAMDMGDHTSFSHLTAFLKYCDRRKLRIMTFASLKDDLPGYRLDDRTLEDDFLTAFLRQLENSAGQGALEHISLCIPDKIFMNKLQLNPESNIRTPLIVTKAAYLVAAIAMRNDSVSKLRQLLGLNKKYIQSEEPGLIIGPETTWRNMKMYKELPELFELDVPSDLNMDAGFMEQLLYPDDTKHRRFSLLYHEKGKNLFLRLFNTGYRADNQCYSVSQVRMCDYLSNVIRKDKNLTRELENPKPKGKVMFDAETPYINTWKPEKVSYNVSQLETDQHSNIKLNID